MAYSPDFLLGLYRQMKLMEAFEERLLALSQEGVLRGSLHLATGQEALPAGACAALDKNDAITVTYRGHGYILAKGGDLGRILAEILGREDGYCRGRGGKMHIFDQEHGVLGANGIVGGGVPTVLGSALAAKTLKDGSVSMTVFGDGAMNQGVVPESLNLAALWKLPVIFLCENNLYAEMTPLDRSTRAEEQYKRAAAYGMTAKRIDGNDVLEVYETVKEAAEACRKGKGPVFIEAMTYRTCGHYQLDPGYTYRSREEVDAWRAKSPINRFEAKLSELGIKKKDIEKAAREGAEAVAKAEEFARRSPEPTMADLFAEVAG